jgi:hypothetical protein
MLQLWKLCKTTYSSRLWKVAIVANSEIDVMNNNKHHDKERATEGF